MDKLKMHTVDRAEENYKKLCELFPNAITETINEDGEVVRAIDADVLRQEISAAVVEGSQERYQFTWPDKKKSVVLANQPIAKTLRLDRSKSVGRDGTSGSIDTENIYIEGDNLDALKLLQETYLGKVKMIYIDPPYNTGNDFVYEDDFRQDTGEYLPGSGQFDDQGYQLVQNTESNGRFHTDWLNMLYPRLRIARDLLTDDGVIFISIDDNEIENLRKACDELFGEENFVAEFIWKSRQNKDNRNLTGVSIDHEYILTYSKNIAHRALKGSERKTNQYTNPDNDPRGPWASANMVGLLPADQRPNCHYDLINPFTGINYGKPDMGWRYDKKTMSRLIEEDRIIWPNSPEGRPRKKSFLSEISQILPGFSSIVGQEIFTRTATKEVQDLFEGKFFDYPKPVELIKEFISQTTENNSIILDFFSGSATTAHAVMQLNAEDGGNRKFILVQLPEVTDEKSEARKAGYETICDIGEERIRRAGKRIREEIEKKQAESEQLTLDNNSTLHSPHSTLDTGFRVFRVDSSNMENVYYAPADFEQAQLELLADNIKPDRTPEDLLFQVMLDLGIMLSSEIEETEIDGKKVFIVGDKYEDSNGNVLHHLVACFDNDITEETVKAIAKMQPFRVFS